MIIFLIDCCRQFEVAWDCHSVLKPLVFFFTVKSLWIKENSVPQTKDHENMYFFFFFFSADVEAIKRPYYWRKLKVSTTPWTRQFNATQNYTWKKEGRSIWTKYIPSALIIERLFFFFPFAFCGKIQNNMKVLWKEREGKK